MRPLRPATPSGSSGTVPDPDPANPDGPQADGSAADPAQAGEARREAAEDKVVKGPARRRLPFAHAVRLPPPRQAVAGAARATRAWARRPSGRLTLSGVFLLALVTTTGAVGAVVVPSAVRSTTPVAADATDSSVAVVPPPGALPDGTAAVVPGPPVSPGFSATAVPGGVATSAPAAVPGTARPADAIAEWARVTGAKVGVSPVAMQAYGFAELALAETHRGCQLSWTTLAAIGYVESRHGQANGATLKSTGRAEPEIIGDPLDGNGGRSLIRDTDRGLFDRDTTYDRAIGPMQFIPTTWQEIGADADNDGRKDPHDLDDATLAAGRYLCKGGRNMTVPGDWWGAILSYNDVRRYATDVFDKANEYGRTSRT
ncbi:lytic murein transglycosylase [Micromonospora sp. KC721]|uniref:lytic transglycosylase domain-containing protein n=1 Tax=Micromonospora sp. KC721 TaxID=2530380 RepID=UPI0026C8FF7A